MAKEKKIYVFVIAVLVFILYILAAAQPIPPETILTYNWLRPLDSDYPEEENSPPAGYVLPFTLGNRFGYVDSSGTLLFNKVREKYISVSGNYWSEYDPVPASLEIKSPLDNRIINLNSVSGYPFFIGTRIFIIHKDQSSLEERDGEGQILWSYDFEAPITTIDASTEYVLAGTLDGMVNLLDHQGQSVFPSFAPGASRIPVIVGCRISADGSKLAIVSGIDKQRFLFLERYGGRDYRVTYHELLNNGDGFRREIRMDFIDNDSRVVFEQEDGLGVFDVKSRSATTLPFREKLEALDDSGGGGLLFIVTSGGNRQKHLKAIRLPETVLLDAPFYSDTVFLARRDRDLVIGGGLNLISFSLNKK